MNLALITDAGEVIIITENIDDYNLEKSFARTEVVSEIMTAVAQQKMKEARS